MARRASLLALLALLGGCGFHLQGVSRLPPAFQATQLQADDRYTEFYRALVADLRAAGTRLVEPAEAPGAAVEILADDSGQRVLSVSATNIPTEYEVYYTVRYRVRVGGKEVLPPQTLTRTRGYSFLESAALAKEQEQQLLTKALAQDIAALVLRRLAALAP